MNYFKLIASIFIFSLLITKTQAQLNPSTSRIAPQINGEPITRCATMEVYGKLFKQSPALKLQFEANQKRISKANPTNSVHRLTNSKDTITVIIHVVGNASLQSKVTNAYLASQIDVLNEDYNAANADSVRIPAAFRTRFGNMQVNFQLAQTDPDGLPTNGIERRTNDIAFDVNTFDDAKTFGTGGLDGWNGTQYLNLWVVDFGQSGLLGISVFPGDPRPVDVHGIVCDYRAFGRGAPYLFKNYNTGKTASHEVGHFFNLRHIWGDDGGDCSETDFPDAPAGQDDTPNQGDYTKGNPDLPGTGTVVTDNCSVSAPGIMYQNYMDYSYDAALVMFTNGQVSRMQTALNTSPDRSSLLNSTAFHPPVNYTYDARVKTIVTPSLNSSSCNTDFSPSVRVKNQGLTTLTSVTINIIINNKAAGSKVYSVNLPYRSDTVLVLTPVTGISGKNILKIYTSLPNGTTDQNIGNDTAVTHFTVKEVLPLTTSITESFSSSVFPPQNWEVLNPDNDLTWQWTPDYGARQKGSAWFNDYINQSNDLHDDLVMPNYSYKNIDSIYLSFNLADAMFSDPFTTSIPIDTLSVLLSKDCGNTYTIIYKKWGADLQTATNPPVGVTTEFFPASFNWRKDSIYLGQWLGTSEPQLQIAFRFSGNIENNFFLDDINLYTKVLPVALKDNGYLILPTVFENQFAVWHYKNPDDLRYINVYSASGVLVWSRNYNGFADTYITIDLTNMPKGVYFVNIGYSDKKPVSQRVIKN